MNIIPKATSALTAATVLAVCTAMTAIAATTGDLNKDGVIDSFDLILCRKNLITMFSGGQADMLGDIDGNGSIQINDLVLLQKYVLGSIKEFPQTTNTTTTITTTMTSSPDTTTTTVNSGGSYMNKMTADIHLHEDTAVTEKKNGVDYGKIEKKTYYSKDAEREKNLNILLPPGYDNNQKYPVMYVFHGIFGYEDSMIDDSMKIQTMLGNLVASGEAEKMIIVFPQMFTTKDRNLFPAFTNESSRAYDAIREDLENSIMPFMEENYPIKTGRENTAINGFSMGGREAL